MPDVMSEVMPEVMPHAKPRRFLFALWDGAGTVPPIIGVAQRLRARGHAVRVLADPTIEAEARSAGCEFTSWTSAPHRTTRDRSGDIIVDYDGRSIAAMMREYMGSFLGGPAPRWASDVVSELKARPVDCFVYDQMLPAASIAAEKMGISRVALAPNIWLLPVPGMPPMGTGFTPARGPLSRFRDATIRSVMTRLFERALPPINAARASLGLPDAPSMQAQFLNADATYVLTSPRFDWPSPALPKNVFYAGPILDDPTWTDPWRSPWAADDLRPLVLVGLSSCFQGQVAVLNALVRALATLPVRALVTLGNSVSPCEVGGADNVVVVKSAPHAEVLRSASLLITHCGHGTTMKGLVAGVPLLCVPMGRDQGDNAARVLDRGAGLRVKANASVAKIAAAVQTLLQDPKYKRAAERLGKIIQDGDGCVDVVDELERRTATSRGEAVPACG